MPRQKLYWHVNNSFKLLTLAASLQTVSVFHFMEPQITIRRCTVADATTLSHIACRTFYDTFFDTCTEEDMEGFLEQHYNTDQLESELGNPADYYYFAEIDGKPVGYLRFAENPVPYERDNDEKALELNRLYVDEQYHGRGIAKLLMAFYEHFAARNGYKYLWLGVWEHNARAQAFYRKFGYRFNGHKHDFPIGSTPQMDEWWDKTIPQSS